MSWLSRVVDNLWDRGGHIYLRRFESPAEVRAAWPTWRRAVRAFGPIFFVAGVIVWFVGVVIGIIAGRFEMQLLLFTRIWVGVLVLCVCYDAIDGYLRRRRTT